MRFPGSSFGLYGLGYSVQVGGCIWGVLGLGVQALGRWGPGYTFNSGLEFNSAGDLEFWTSWIFGLGASSITHPLSIALPLFWEAPEQ